MVVAAILVIVVRSRHGAVAVLVVRWIRLATVFYVRCLVLVLRTCFSWLSTEKSQNTHQSTLVVAVEFCLIHNGLLLSTHPSPVIPIEFVHDDILLHLLYMFHIYDHF